MRALYHSWAFNLEFKKRRTFCRPNQLQVERRVSEDLRLTQVRLLGWFVALVPAAVSFQLLALHECSLGWRLFPSGITAGMAPVKEILINSPIGSKTAFPTRFP